ncbi:MAG: hypothetical protein BZ138_05970 [Methanosphaera sp. rholeuAM270]|nr:MAG: hypothetical protein BZ138_05970 [Methanosphaera sp. rholeuAM270]
MQFRNEIEILQEMLTHAQNTGLLSITDDTLQEMIDGNITENQYVLDLSTHAHILAELEELLSDVYRSIDVNTAVGEELDRLGRLVNITRGVAQPAMVDCTISVPVAEDEDITVPAGTPVIIEEVVGSTGVAYVTHASATLVAGMTSVPVVCVNSELGFTTQLPANSVTGLEGFPTLTLSNSETSTNGKNIEEDDSYRERIKNWTVQNIKGTRECFDNYLSNYTGLDGYRLIPRYNGMGTLKVVCDTISSELANIQAGIQQNCMLLTDEPVVCVLPDSTTIATLELTVDIVDNMLLTLGELEQLIVAQTRVYLEGGRSRLGQIVQGLGIGDDFIPSQLIAYLLKQIPEVVNIIVNPASIITVSDLNVLTVTEIEVNINV